MDMTTAQALRARDEGLDTYARNLDLYFDDNDIEARGDRFVVYLDAAEIITGILGMYDFFDPIHLVLKTSFWTDRALACCLALRGHFGPIHLLPPHQPEVAEKTRQHSIFQDKRGAKPKDDAQAFFDAIRSEYPLDTMDLPDVDKTWNPQQRRYYEVWFQTLQCIRGTWQERFVLWSKTGGLVPQTAEQIDRQFGHREGIRTLTRDPDFHKIFLGLADHPGRRHLVHNNLKDAVSILMLRTLVRKYKRGLTTTIPLFMDPHGVFSHVIRVAEVEDDFAVEAPSGRLRSVFRTCEYLAFSAALPRDTLESLRPLRGSLHTALAKEDSDAMRAALEEISLPEHDRPFSDLLRENRYTGFVHRVWLPFVESMQASNQSIPKLLHGIIDELPDKVSRQGEREDLRLDIEQRLNSLTTSIHDWSRKWDEVYDLCSVFWTAVGDLRQRFPASNSDTVLRDMGMLQFALPKEVHSELVKDLLALHDGGSAQQGAVIGGLVDVCMDLQETSRPNDSPRGGSDLHRAVYLLYVLERFDWILRIYDRYFHHGQQPAHFSIHLMYARAVLEPRRQASVDAVRGAFDLVEHLRALQTSTEDQEERALLAIGIAYIYFKVWQYKGFHPAWGHRPQSAVPAVLSEGDELIDMSVKAAKDSLSLFAQARAAAEEKTGNRQRESLEEVYAINLLLYVLVEGARGQRQHRIQMDDAMLHLLSFKGDSTLWQFRYDDTLGRYCHRLAQSTPVVERRETLLADAERYFSDAIRLTDDSRVKTHFLMLQADRSTGDGALKGEKSGIEGTELGSV